MRLSEFTRETPANLIAMSSHGHSGVKSMGAWQCRRDGCASLRRSGFGAARRHLTGSSQLDGGDV